MPDNSPRRIALASFAVSLLACALLAGCSSTPISPDATLSGTAATGRPMAKATVVVKDHLGKPVVGATDLNGKFSVDVKGLEAPFLLSASASGVTVFSVGTQTGIVNIDPLTDLVIATWYKVQGLSASDAFATLGPATPMPTAAEVRTMTAVIHDIANPLLVAHGVDAPTFDLITTPFEANGQGFDAVLDGTTVASDRSRVDFVNRKTGDTQTTSLALDASGLRLSTQATHGGVTTTGSHVVEMKTKLLPPAPTSYAGDWTLSLTLVAVGQGACGSHAGLGPAGTLAVTVDASGAIVVTPPPGESGRPLKLGQIAADGKATMIDNSSTPWPTMKSARPSPTP